MLCLNLLHLCTYFDKSFFSRVLQRIFLHLLKDWMKRAHHGFEESDPPPEPSIDFSIDGVLEEHVVNFHISSLPNPVDAANSLFDAHRIPWQVKVDYDATELEVLAFAASLRTNHYGCILLESFHGIISCDSFPSGPVPDLPSLSRIADNLALVSVGQCFSEVLKSVVVLRENDDFVYAFPEQSFQDIVESCQLRVRGERAETSE